MQAIVIDQPGDETVLQLGTAPDPELGPGQVRIAVAASALNRADLLQRQGMYPPPPGASPILGLECSGTVAEVGEGVAGLEIHGIPWSGLSKTISVADFWLEACLSESGYARFAVVHGVHRIFFFIHRPDPDSK